MLVRNELLLFLNIISKLLWKNITSKDHISSRKCVMSDVFLIAPVALQPHPAASDCFALWAKAGWARRAANGGRLLLVKGAGRLKVPGRARRCNVFVNHRDKPYSVRYLKHNVRDTILRMKIRKSRHLGKIMWKHYSISISSYKTSVSTWAMYATLWKSNKKKQKQKNHLWLLG